MNLKYVFQVHVRVSKRALAALNTEIATMQMANLFIFGFVT
jgi:hypothetical protein